MILLSKHNENVDFNFLESEQELKDIFEKSDTSKYISYEDFANNNFQYYNEELDFLTEVYFTIEELLDNEIDNEMDDEMDDEI